jgi:hypothetical protein
MRRATCVAFVLVLGAVLLGGCNNGGGGDNPAILSFLASGFSVNEDGTPVTVITLTRTGNSSNAVSTTVVLTDGTATGGPPPLFPPVDYDNTPIVVTWPSGDTADKVIAVPILDDNADEADETLTMSLTALTGGAVLGAIGSATLTIVDEDVAGSIQFSSMSYAYLEDGSPISAVTLQRVGGMDGDISATIVSTDGTANSDPFSPFEPVDYTAVNTIVTFLDQVTTDVVLVLPGIVQDVLPELDEDFTLTIVSTTGNASIGSPSSATVTIIDDDDMLEIPNPAAEVNGLFGWSVAKVGPSLAVGAPGSNPPAGVARLFDPSLPSLLTTLSQPFSQQFGVEVAADGVDLLVGSSGAAWFFDAPIATSGLSFTSALDGFGTTMISLGDGRLVIGAPLAQTGGGSSGAFLVYDDVFGTLHQTIEGKGVEKYGASFALAGSHLLVGAPGGNGTVHRYSGNPLALSLVIDNPSPGPASPAFGEAVGSLGATTILVGAPDEDTFAANDGRLYMFDGGPVTTILSPGGILANGRFGSEIVVIGNRICVQEQGGGPAATGRVYVLDANGALVQIIDAPAPAANADFGASMCEFDGALVVGAPKYPFLLQSGTVFIFKIN